MPQNGAVAAVVAQFAAVDRWISRRFLAEHAPAATVWAAFEQLVSQKWASIVEVVPPLLNWLISSRSPFWWLPLNLKPPCEAVLVRLIFSLKNQKPSWASPLLSKRSTPKKMTSQVVAAAGAGHVLAFFGSE